MWTSYLILSYLNNLITWIYNFKQEIKSDQHWALYVILNDKDREQNHAQSEDIQLDTVQNSTIGVDASAADLLLALVGEPPKQIKQKPVIDAKQVVSETGYLPMAACILQEARKKYSKHSVNERVTLDTSAYTTKFAYSIHEETAYG